MNRYIHTFSDGTQITLTVFRTEKGLKIESSIKIYNFPHLFLEYVQWRDTVVVPNIQRQIADGKI